MEKNKATGSNNTKPVTKAVRMPTNSETTLPASLPTVTTSTALPASSPTATTLTALSASLPTTTKSTTLPSRTSTSTRFPMQKPQLTIGLYKILLGILLSIWMITGVSSVGYWLTSTTPTLTWCLGTSLPTCSSWTENC